MALPALTSGDGSEAEDGLAVCLVAGSSALVPWKEEFSVLET
jgi:hypothetical protein